MAGDDLGAAAEFMDQRAEPKRRRQLGHQEVEENRELLPVRIREGQDGRDEGVGPGEGFRLALEINLPVLVQVRIVDGDARIQYVLSSGSDLPGVEDGSIEAVWSFDVFVHVAPSEQAA